MRLQYIFQFHIYECIVCIIKWEFSFSKKCVFMIESNIVKSSVVLVLLRG